MMEPLDASELAADAALLASPHHHQQLTMRSGNNGQQSVAIAAANGRAATVWSSSYSSALSKSMRAMIGVNRLRQSSTRSDSEAANYNSHGSLEAGTYATVMKSDDVELQQKKVYKRLLLALESKDEREICELVAQSPQVLRMADKVWTAALGVCAWLHCCKSWAATHCIMFVVI